MVSQASPFPHSFTFSVVEDGITWVGMKEKESTVKELRGNMAQPGDTD